MRSISYRAIFMFSALCFTGSAALAVPQEGAPANARQAASMPTPRTADGHPDLSGLWAGGGGGGGGAVNATNEDYNKTDANGFAPSIIATRGGGFVNFERDNTLVRRMGTNKPMYRPKYWETVKMLDQNGNKEDPGYNCMPAGVPRLGPPAQIVETAKQLIMLYPGQGGAVATTTTYRIIPIDGRKHSNLEDLDGTWNGEGIGHWEGDTMVIDTIGFNTATWIESGGYFHSENMHVVEKLTRNGNALTWQATVDDPDVLLQPWTLDTRTVRLNPDPMAILPESPPCSERDMPHAVTKEHH
jgi:hypothetical protein